MAHDDWRPSTKLNNLLMGRLPWDKADNAVKSMARLHIHHAAVKIRDCRTPPERVAMLEKIPENIRPHVKKRVEEIWKDRRKK